MLDRELLGQAACADPQYFSEMWFPESWTDSIAEAAKRVCRHCPIKKECREAGRHEAFGIWGGVMSSQGKMATEPPVKWVPSVGSTRRIRALATLGWTPKEISVDIRRYTGLRVQPHVIDTIRDGSSVNQIEMPVAEGIKRAFTHLKTSTNHGGASTSTAAMAKTEGWPGPYRWKGVDIDDPESEARPAL